MKESEIPPRLLPFARHAMNADGTPFVVEKPFTPEPGVNYTWGAFEVPLSAAELNERRAEASELLGAPYGKALYRFEEDRMRRNYAAAWFKAYGPCGGCSCVGACARIIEANPNDVCYVRVPEQYSVPVVAYVVAVLFAATVSALWIMFS